MKTGKYVKLEKQNNILLSYGSVNTKSLKSVFLRLQCWVQPRSADEEWDRVIARIRREVITCMHRKIDHSLFNPNIIVDLDLRSSGILLDKRSFLSCEITFYTRDQIDIRSEYFYSVMQRMSAEVIGSVSSLFSSFDVYERKK